ncbi:MAG: hypothetical protein D6705_15925 [Deltaproteobacteria bacterium]|nr:MAG: hypothetical protein D6705_15925 [Deltaproteobacteria bacterium]
MRSTIFVRGAAAFRGDAKGLRPAILPPMLRRRTSPLTRAVAQVVGEIGERFGADLAHVPVVHGSEHGEIAVTVDLLHAALSPDGEVSPTRFHNSVHNTPIGYVSIACGNRAGHTTVAAGADTCAMAFLEAAARLSAGRGEVLVVVADEPVPPPLPRRGPAEVTAAAFLLAAAPAGESSRLEIVEGPAEGALPECAATAAYDLAGAARRAAPAACPLSARDPFAVDARDTTYFARLIFD